MIFDYLPNRSGSGSGRRRRRRRQEAGENRPAQMYLSSAKRDKRENAIF